MSIDTWTLPTPQTLVSIDTSQTLSDTAPTRSDTPNWRFRQLRRVRRVYRVSIVSNSDTLTLLTRPTRLETHVSPHKSPRMPTAKLGMQPMGLLGGSNPWPWPFGTTTPSTSAVGRHPDTSDTSDTQTLDTQTRSDTTHASQLSRALRHRLDTGQTPLTLLTPVSIDTAQTRLRHCSDTPDTSDTQTQQGSRERTRSLSGAAALLLLLQIAPPTTATSDLDTGPVQRFYSTKYAQKDLTELSPQS